MNGLYTCRTRKSSKKAVNTELYLQNNEVLSSLVLRMAKLEQCILVQRCEIGVLEAEIEVLRNHAVLI